MLNDFRNVRAAVLCSKRAPGLDYVLQFPSRGAMFDVACVITTEDEFPDRGIIQSQGVPVMTHALRTFHVDRGMPIRDRAVRADYDAITAGVLRKLHIDVVVCLGYVFVLTEPMLTSFANRIFNIHDSDLSLVNHAGRRRYTGLHSTRDAILAGENETRSTLHVVTRELDAGPVVSRSESFPVAPLVNDALAFGALDILRAYSYAHREWMMCRAWGPMVVQLLERVAAGIQAVAV
jgi:folate-dependent phosphoribosylglycinamide formyltransferase PurN